MIAPRRRPADVRLRLLRFLDERWRPAAELAERADVVPSQAGQALKALRAEGLVEYAPGSARHRGTWRAAR